MSLTKIARKIKKLALVSLIPRSINVKQFGWNKRNESELWASQMRKKGFTVFAEDVAGDMLTLIGARTKEEAAEALTRAYQSYGISKLQPKLIEYR